MWALKKARNILTKIFTTRSYVPWLSNFSLMLCPLQLTLSLKMIRMKLKIYLDQQVIASKSDLPFL